MKHLLDKVITEEVPFMGETVKVKKLSVVEIMKVQELTKSLQESEDEAANLDLMFSVIRLAVPDAADLSNEDMKNFPIGELSDLSNSILAVSGLGETSGN